MDLEPPLLSDRTEQALRRAARWHNGQTRRATDLPYLAHPMAVALILDRLGFAEDVVIAALLHDTLEDTAADPATIEAEFGPRVRSLIEQCSEAKVDARGAARPWDDRKRDHIAGLAGAPVEVRAIVLADKLHNLLSIRADLDAGEPVWERFHAPADRQHWYHATLIRSLGRGEPRLVRLAAGCARLLDSFGIGPAVAPADQPEVPGP